MKKRIYVILTATAMMLAGCYDDSALQERMEVLEKDVTAIQGDIASIKKELETINTNLTALQEIVQALQDNVYVSDVYEVKDQTTGKVIGFTIVFTNDEIITIYNGKDGEQGEKGDAGEQGVPGNDGETPVIGIKMADGVWYWTLNGEFLTDENGNKIPATGADGKDGATPQLRIEEGYWEVSFDGTNWERVGSATGTVTATDAVFSDVKETSEGILFILADGSKILIPREQAFGLVFEKTDGFEVSAGNTTYIPYTVRNSNETTVVDAMASGDWHAEVVATDHTSGKVAVTASEDGKDGKVMVYATDGNGKADIKTLCFSNGVLSVVAPSEEVPVEGGTVEVNITSNITYTVDIPSGTYWVSLATETKADSPVTKTVSFSVAPNATPENRTAAISIIDAQGCAAYSFVIIQAGNTYTAPAFACDEFEKYILDNFDLDKDGEISEEEAAGVEEINYTYNNGDGVASFAGVEAFYNLKTFIYDGQYTYSSSVESIDLSHNGKLETIAVKNVSSVTALNVSGLKNVRELSIAATSVGSIDLTAMGDLQYLYAQNSSLETLDLSGNPELLEASVYGTKISSLDVSPCTKLKELHAGVASLTSIDLSANAALERLYLDDAGISTLDCSALSGLTYFQMYNAPALEAIDLSHSPLLTTFYAGNLNKVKQIDVSAASGLSTFNIYNYYSLETVRFSAAVKDKFTISGYWGNGGEEYIYVTLEYVEGETVVIDDYSCYITDEYARKHVLKEYDADNDGKIDADEANTIKELDLSDYGLTSAAGLEMFPLEILDLSGNNLTEFDAAKLTTLKWLDLSDNKLTSVTALDEAEDMTYLDLSGNQLSGKLSDRNLPYFFLTHLDISDNAAVTLDPYYMTSLVELNASNTALESLYPTDIAATVEVLNLSCTKLSGQVKFTRASSLRVLDISNTAITSIDITAAATKGSIEKIYASGTPLELILVGTGNTLPEGAVSGAEDYGILNVDDPTKTLTSNEWGYITAFTPGTGAESKDFRINFTKASSGFVIEAGGEADITVKEGCKVLKMFAVGVNGTPTVEIVRSSGKSILTKATDSSSWGDSYKSTGDNPFTASLNSSASTDETNLLINGDTDYRFWNFGAAYDSSSKTVADEVITFKVTGNAGEKVILFGINMSSSRDDEE